MKIKYERTTIDEKSNGEDLIAPADTVEKIETIRRSKFLDITRQKKIGQKETVVQFRFQCDEYPCIDSKFPELEAATAEYEENIAGRNSFTLDLNLTLIICRINRGSSFGILLD